MFLSGLLDAGIGVYGAGNHGVDKDDHSLCPDADAEQHDKQRDPGQARDRAD